MLTKQKARVLIASEFHMLAESIGTAIEANPAFQFEFTCSTNMGLLTEIERIKADLIVLLNEDSSVPGIASHIFNEYPGVIVIVFNPADNEAVLCKQSISKELLETCNLVDLLQQVSSEERCEYWGKSP